MNGKQKGVFSIMMEVLISKIVENSKFCLYGYMLNPFTLRAAKTGLIILEIFFKQKQFLQNI